MAPAVYYAISGPVNGIYYPAGLFTMKVPYLLSR